MKFKNFLIITVLSFLVGFAGFNLVVPVQATQDVVVDGCEHSCPTVEWTHTYCPQGYSEHGDTCRKLVWNGHGFDWSYTDKVAGETFNVTYNKSEDPNKCHRPSVGQLKDDEGYDMSNSQATAFTQENPEWLDSIDVVPEGYYYEDGACYPNPEEETDYCDTVEGTQPEDYDCPKEEEPTCEELQNCEEEPRGNGGTPPTFASSSTEAPSCSNGNTTKVVANGHAIRGVNGDFSKAVVNAFLTEGDRVHVFWRIVGQVDWVGSSAITDPEGVKPNSDNFISYQVNELDPNGDYDFGILQANGCGGGTIAVIKDGAVSKTFHVTSYE